MQKYHRCDTIIFGDMKNEYLDSVANIPVRVDGRLEKVLKDKERCLS